MRSLSTRLAELDAQHLRRTLRPPYGVDLTSNDYLGLANHPCVREALRRALDEGLPHGATGSRLLSGEHPAWSDLETAFAAWQGTEASLFHATGFAANTGLLPALVSSGDRVLSDALNHASLIDGVRLTRGVTRCIVPHLDLDAYARALAEPHDGTTWVVVESVYSMDGDVAPLAELARLTQRHGARLIVDEAHATGLFGDTGAGMIEAAGIRDAVFASIHTAGKALGQSGAWVAGSRDLVDWLVQKSRPFVFSTAPAPFLAYGLGAAIRWIRSHPEQRVTPLRHGARLRAALSDHLELGPSSTHIVPVYTRTPAAALSLQAHLANLGWDARAIRPPTVPENTSRVRMVMSNHLTDDDVDRLIEGLLQWR